MLDIGGPPLYRLLVPRWRWRHPLQPGWRPRYGL